MVQHQFRDDPNAALMSRGEEFIEVLELPVLRVDARVVSNVIASVFERRGIEGQEPNRRDAQVLEVIELLSQAPKGAFPAPIAVKECANRDLVNDCILIPK